MTKRPSLSSVVEKFDKRTKGAATPADHETPAKSSKPPSRQGKKAITLWAERETWQQLRVMGIEHDKPIQALMIEALNLLFEAYQKPPIAK